MKFFVDTLAVGTAVGTVVRYFTAFGTSVNYRRYSRYVRTAVGTARSRWRRYVRAPASADVRRYGAVATLQLTIQG